MATFGQDFDNCEKKACFPLIFSQTFKMNYVNKIQLIIF